MKAVIQLAVDLGCALPTANLLEEMCAAAGEWQVASSAVLGRVSLDACHRLEDAAGMSWGIMFRLCERAVSEGSALPTLRDADLAVRTFILLSRNNQADPSRLATPTALLEKLAKEIDAAADLALADDP